MRFGHCGPAMTPDGTYCLDWPDFSKFQVMVAFEDGTFIIVCWWVLKPLLLPLKPCLLELLEMPVLRRLGPWRLSHTATNPQVVAERYTPPGVCFSQDGRVNGTICIQVTKSDDRVEERAAAGR